MCLHQETNDARVALTYTITVGRGQHIFFYVSPNFGRETHTLSLRTKRLSPEEFRDVRALSWNNFERPVTAFTFPRRSMHRSRSATPAPMA